MFSTKEDFSFCNKKSLISLTRDFFLIPSITIVCINGFSFKSINKVFSSTEIEILLKNEVLYSFLIDSFKSLSFISLPILRPLNKITVSFEILSFPDTLISLITSAIEILNKKNDTNILIKNMKGIDRIRYIKKTYGKNND